MTVALALTAQGRCIATSAEGLHSESHAGGPVVHVDALAVNVATFNPKRPIDIS